MRKKRTNIKRLVKAKRDLRSTWRTSGIFPTLPWFLALEFAIAAPAIQGLYPIFFLTSSVPCINSGCPHHDKVWNIYQGVLTLTTHDKMLHLLAILSTSRPT